MPGRRILMIDDDAQLRGLLGRFLEWSGYEVLEARDGRNASQLIEEFEVRLVITDIFMPEKEGLETVMDLRKEYPNLKIVAISGGGQCNGLDYLEAAKKFGADICLRKPFRPGELAKSISSLLR